MVSSRIKILYEDMWLLAANKPAGIPVHQTLDKFRPHFQGLLEKQLGQKLVLFHRLDSDTSGIVLLGKNPDINKSMTDLFRDREIKKIYNVCVEGEWPENLTSVEGYIKESPNKKGSYILSPKGKASEKSQTLFRVLKKINLQRTFLEGELLTGRTHQIRVHCASQGFPVCGDKFYGHANKNSVPMALHARRLEFLHPKIKDKLIVIESELPEYWQFWFGEIKT